ncbi:flippase [Thermodesulfovibrio thiophilus]|uniref:flippase n=1 Tax=Thermodesulfovibrio thiophilus TaxID=340095 RepID=UPI002352F86B|nr:flippase [Thermodesulfovibrio thiophilus]
MINIIKNLLNTDEKKRLFSNFFSLSVLQAANYILPLITLPYLVRVLGPEKFGLIAFSQAFIQYFNILTDYGFNLSATREISIHRDSKEKLNEIFSSVMIIKVALLVISFIIMTIIVFSFEKFRQDWLIYYLTFGMVLGQVLFPVWFFQGMERMKYITYLNITARLIFTVAIFVFIHHERDFLYVPLINTLGMLMAGFIALWIIFKDFKINFKMPSITETKHQFREGWYIFISTVAISFYTISNTFILGLFTNNTIVGYYSGAEKIVKAIQGLLSPVSQAIYPYISKLASQSKEQALSLVKKMIKLIGQVGLIISLFLFIFSNIIVKILLGNQYQESVTVLRILSFLPFIIGLSNVLGIQTMLTFNYKKAFSNILIATSIINITLAFVLVPLFQHIGISISVLISEIFVTSSMFIYLRRKGIYFWGGKKCLTT